MQRSLWHKVGKIPLNFFQFHILLFSGTEAILTGLFLFDFETIQWMNCFEQILSIPFCGYRDIVILAIFRNGRWQPSWNAILQNNNIALIMQRSLWHKVGMIPLRFFQFLFCYF